MNTQFENLSATELMAIWTKEETSQEDKDTIWEILSKIQKESSNEHKLINFIQTAPVEEISIDSVQVITEDGKEPTENLITTLIEKGKIPEEKAFYALSMQSVVKVFSALKQDNIAIKDTLARMEDNIAELSKQKNEESETKLTKLKEEYERKKVELENSNKDLEALKVELENSNKDLADLKKQLENAESNSQQKEKDTTLITKLTNDNAELKKDLEQITEEQKTYEQMIDLIARILNKESYEITINSIESILSNSINHAQNQMSTNESETTIQNLEAEVSALKASNSEKDKTIVGLTNDRDSLRNQLAGKKVETTFDNAVNPDTPSQNKEANQEIYDTQEKPKKKINKAFLVLTAVIITIGAGVTFLPKELKAKITNLTELIAQDTKKDVFETLPEATEEVAKPEDDKLSSPEEVIEQKPPKAEKPFASTNDIFKEQVVVEPVETKKDVEKISTIQDQPIIEEPVAEPSSKEYLNSLKDLLKVTPDKKIFYNKEVYKKGDKINNFQIAYITSGFVLFMDHKENNKIIKVVLGASK